MAVELGLSPTEFWGLTWYDWGFYALKHYKASQRRIADQEFQMDLTRRFMALFANAHRAKGQSAFNPEDFFKLSYDTHLKQEVDPELFAKVSRRLGGTIKKKKGDE